MHSFWALTQLAHGCCLSHLILRCRHKTQEGELFEEVDARDPNIGTDDASIDGACYSRLRLWIKHVARE